MKNDIGIIIVSFLIGLLWTFIFSSITMKIVMNDVHKSAIENQCGHYDTNTGNFKWNNQK